MVQKLTENFWQAEARGKETKKFSQVLKAKVIPSQCPPSFKETLENIANMSKFFNSVTNLRYIFAREPRGEWSEVTIKALCSELGLVHFVDPIKKEASYGEPKYFHLHGGSHYRHRYTKEGLEHLREREATEKPTSFSIISIYIMTLWPSSNW